MIGAARWERFVALQRGIVAIKGRAIGAHLLAFIAHVQINMRMIVRRVSTHAHEFSDADLDHVVPGAVLEVRRAITGHEALHATLGLKSAGP